MQAIEQLGRELLRRLAQAVRLQGPGRLAPPRACQPTPEDENESRVASRAHGGADLRLPLSTHGESLGADSLERWIVRARAQGRLQ